MYDSSTPDVHFLRRLAAEGSYKPLLRSTLAGILFVSLAGSAWHFAYDASGQNPVLAYFAPVNESTWEHMKLLYFPMALYMAAEAYILRGKYPGLFAARAAGLTAGLLLIPAIFYTYSGILGRHVPFLDILLFVVSTCAAFFLSFSLVKRQRALPAPAAYLLLALWLAAFLCFTAAPPAIGIFQAPPGA